MKSLEVNSRGQVTIFIIIAIVLVAVIGLFFFLRGGIKIPDIGVGKEKSSSSFLESCIEDKVHETTNLLSLQGGYIEPTLYKSFKFEDENSPSDISYLCYNQNNHLQCVNQEPSLIRHLQDEIKNYISDEVSYCVSELEKDFENQGYAVDSKPSSGFEVDLEKSKIIIDIDKKMILTKSGETTTYDSFKIIVPSRFYDLAEVVLEIVNKEASSCDFTNYDMARYEDVSINKYPTSDSSVIYTLVHRDTGEEFRFTVRGCVIPAGFGIEI